VALAERSATRIALHLDHVTSLDLCREAADLGFGSVMFDASAAGDDENITRTAEATAWAHAQGLVMEAEIGIVGGKIGDHTAGAPTEPEEARRFAERTGADALAVQVGTSHAQTTRTGTLDLERIGRIRDAVAVPLVLHGSSGVADAHLEAGIRQGLVKVNVGTRFNVAFTTAVRTHLGADPAVVDPRRYVGDGRSAMRAEAAGLLRLFGAAGRC
jgi:fructose-bisphosphate aldolase class II